MKVPPINRKAAAPVAPVAAADTNPPKEVLAVSDAKPIPEPPGGNCPPWCSTDHATQGRTHHTKVGVAALENATVSVSLLQASYDASPVVAISGWYGRQELYFELGSADERDSVAMLLELTGESDQTDLANVPGWIRKAAAAVEHAPQAAVRALASDPEEPDFYDICPACRAEWPCEPAMDHGVVELLEQAARTRLEQDPTAGTESEAPW